MLSYWVDLESEELRASPSGNSELLLSFTPAFSPAVGRAFLVWSGVLSGVNGVPFAALLGAEFIIIGIGVVGACGLLIYVGVRAFYNKCRRYGPTERSKMTGCRKQPQLSNADAAAVETGILGSTSSVRSHLSSNVAADGTRVRTAHYRSLGNIVDNQEFAKATDNHGVQVSIERTINAPMPKDAEISCMCVVWGYRNLLPLVAIYPLLCGRFLPYPLVGLFLPERLQLPGLLLLLTAYSIWMYRKLVGCVWLMWCGGESGKKERKDPRAGGNSSMRQPSPKAQEESLLKIV
ncbi:uncharacterized protein LOC129583056 [Paramacrobiotus metropolitanus]|uniref:uncharacterized protein LOC129583056 n=1 Tax=Paramacrobiotus metropolitanus TaxID=2943436 RepID=UPI002445D8E7|nr:uncharacterized protein LOC129583056 [Paramacrobiotus metropolitanus]